jgi:hypothetical protein
MPAKKAPPPAPPPADDADENNKTVKLSAVELRRQLEELGVDMDADHGDTPPSDAAHDSSNP